MGISYKYFVSTIVAIFLALGIGILVGFMLDGETFVQEQQTKTINQIEQKFNKMTATNSKLNKDKADLRKEISKYNSYGRTINKEVLAGKLAGMRIAIVETADDYMYNNILNTINQSGARVVNSVSVKSSNLKDNKDLESKIKDYFDTNKIEHKGNIYSAFFKKLAVAVANNNDSKLLDFAKQEGIIQINKNSKEPADAVIIAGGSLSEEDSSVSKVDKPMISSFKGNDIKVIGVELKNVSYSYMDAYKNASISTVDDIDSPIGFASLCMLLQGREGNYGEKEDATSLMPQGFVTNFKVTFRKVPVQVNQNATAKQQ